mmetsp:Transcript_75415/g.210684  ORF Transcript_75415/g.210684 Transcript_75415/m.210684 type:complete len:111 (-) Transcript_75415:188-520(-)
MSRVLILQASLTGGSICLTTSGGPELCQISVELTSPVADAHGKLRNDLRTGMHGAVVARVGAASLEGQLFSSVTVTSAASADETVTSVFWLAALGRDSSLQRVSSAASQI